jgi:thioredoxin reductase
MFDVIVAGAGVAGLNAALILGRARWRVLVLDSGSPRNAPAAHAHGFLTRDGEAPAELLRLAREEIQAYDSVEIKRAAATSVETSPDGFDVHVEGRGQVTARKLVLATGVTDTLPDIRGMQDLWGNGVHHCPFCHGWQVRDRQWAIFGDSPMAFERVALYRGWASDVVVLANGQSVLEDEDRRRLAALGATLDERRITELQRAGTGDVAVVFEDGTFLVTSAVFVMPGQVHRSGLAAELGCDTYQAPPFNLTFVKADPASGATSVAGVFAAGDIIGPMQSLILAAASGARVGYGITHELAMERAVSIQNAALAGS